MEIPVQLNLAAILVGLGIVAASVIAGSALARRAAKRVNPNDVLRDP